jgi:6-phosphogluconate dehydrogenase
MSRIGIVGTGVMGANLALNIAEKGFTVAVYDRDPAKASAVVGSAGPLAGKLTACSSIAAFAAALDRPRAAIVLVPAGPPVEQTADALAAVFASGDAILDCGNTNFRDTERRQVAYAVRGLDFMGIGISGGEEGARHGPSVMAGGSQAAWQRIGPVFTAAAAQYQGEPCAALLGPGGAGHFVKTIHNGIEYADMEMIAEVYGIMRDGLALEPGAIAEVFAGWNGGRLKSYLVEITATVLSTRDRDTGKPLVDVIRDTAGQKGTGKWATMEAAELGSPATAIEAAVTARLIAANRGARQATAAIYADRAAPAMRRQSDQRAMIDDLEKALLASKVVAYAQGFGVMAAASQEWKWSLPLSTVARIWRAGCIIRSAFLDDIARAYDSDARAGGLILVEPFIGLLKDCEPSLRRIVATAATGGLPIPALAAALAYFDMSRARRSTADLIQGQRDFFGAHGFERTDREGIGFHGPWHREG